MESHQWLGGDGSDVEAVGLCLALELDESSAGSQQVQLLSGNDLNDVRWHRDLPVFEAEVALLMLVERLVLQLSHRKWPILDSFRDDTSEVQFGSLDDGCGLGLQTTDLLLRWICNVLQIFYLFFWLRDFLVFDFFI